MVGTYSETLTRLFALDQKAPVSDDAADESMERREQGDRRVEPFIRPNKR